MILLPDPCAMRAQMEHLFGDLDSTAMIEIAWIKELVDGKKKVGAYLRPFGELDALISKAVTHNGLGENVYLGAALRHSNTTPFGRASDKDFHVASAVWADIDKGEAVQHLGNRWAHCRPTMTIVTGTVPHLRVHAWWRMASPTRDPVRLRKALEGIAYHLGSDPAVKNPSRIMRLAGSVNYPSADKRAKGHVPELVRIHQLQDFRLGATTIEGIEAAFPLKHDSRVVLAGKLIPTIVVGGNRRAAYVRKALEGELWAVATAPEHTRNSRLYRAARRLFDLSGPWLPVSVIVPALLDASRCSGLVEAEVVPTLQSAAKACGLSL